MTETVYKYIDAANCAAEARSLQDKIALHDKAAKLAHQVSVGYRQADDDRNRKAWVEIALEHSMISGT